MVSASILALYTVKACTGRAPKPSNMRVQSPSAFALHGVSFHSGLSGGIWQIRKLLVAALCVCAGSAAAFAPGASPGLT
jgi:hypothetical protein